MRIAMVSYSFYEVDNRVMRYAEALTAHGHQVEVFALGRDTDPRRCHRVHGVAVTHLQSRRRNEHGPLMYLVRIMRFLLAAIFAVGWRHLRRRYDVVHVHSVPDFLVFAALIPKLTGAGVILDIHDILPELYADKFGCGRRSPLFRLLCAVEHISASFADHEIVANDLWRERLISRSVASERCSTFLNYPDRAIFRRELREREREDRRLIFLYPGSLSHFQGLHVAIRAFALIASALPAAELHIYGEGNALPELRRLTAELLLGERVRFFPPLPLRQVAGRMANADVAVVPKLAEGFAATALSTKIFEFMSLGVPVIASETPIERYYFSNAELCYFPSGDSAALAAQMLRLGSDATAREQLAAKASLHLAAFDWSVQQHRYLRLVESLAGVSQSGAPHVTAAISCGKEGRGL